MSNLPTTIPPAFLAAYNKRQYIPFNYLTEEKLRHFAIHPPKIVRKISFEAGTMSNKVFDFIAEGETSISIPEYDEATRNFLRIVETVTPARTALWKTHFNFIQTYSRRIHYHEALVKYCITKRQNLAVGEDPSSICTQLLQQLCNEHDLKVLVKSHAPVTATTAHYEGSSHGFHPYGRGAPPRGGFMCGRGVRGSPRGISDNGWAGHGRGSFRKSAWSTGALVTGLPIVTQMPRSMGTPSTSRRPAMESYETPGAT
ncbi:hypothetical protein FB451DRAFT_1191911 [Mycena latifolia]|nr:hypothetical protein FB451DRAFT_1191911 [Mycena latifolia]